ncbi:hypothetical protein BD408DRAFT_419038 [Parasitella parasitica]|nr:hypothetical protein BD408DRAFT_419038 [Parasitella parasitica]
MTAASNQTDKFKTSSVKIEPDVSLSNAISALKRTRNDAEQQPVAKRRTTARPDSREIQEEDFEQISESLSQVDIQRGPSSPCVPAPMFLPVMKSPSIPGLIQNVRKVPTDETACTKNILERDSGPKVRKITDFFSTGHFDPNKFFKLPKPIAEPPARPSIENNVKVKIETTASTSISDSKATIAPKTPKTSKTPKTPKTPKTLKAPREPSASKAPKAPTCPKKKVPLSANPRHNLSSSSRRLIKPDPEETTSEEQANAVEVRNQSKVKSEPNDDELRFVRSSPPAAPETDLSLSQIKVLLQNIHDGLEPDIFDPNYCCKVCSKPFDKQKTFFNHVNMKHGINIEERKFIVLNYGPQPKITDASLFCAHCQKQYESYDRFQHHNELHHGAEKIKLGRVAHKRRKGESPTELDLEEDEMEEQERRNMMEKPENNVRNPSRKYLQNHKNLGYCQAAILKHKGPPPDVNDPDFHCSVCNITYADRGKFHVHLRGTHKMNFPFALSTEKVRKAYNGPLPDIHHPQNYCCVCNVFYSQKLVYTYHLRKVHNMDIPFDKSPGIRIAVDDITVESRKPDMNDPDYFCAYCSRGYTQRSSYLIHLNKMHFMDIPQRRPGALKPRPPLEPGVSPDVLDPNHYCCICDVKFAHANSYRIHIKKYHALGDALEAITLTNRKKRSCYYLDRKITNAGYHEERAKSGQQRLGFKPSKI